MSDRNVVVLKGEIERNYEEGRAAADLSTGTPILPGHLLMLNEDEELEQHDTAGADCEILVAVEDDFRGMTVDGDLPSDGVVAGGEGIGYVAGDLVRYHIGRKGDVLQMILAASQSADPSKFATSNGDGTLKVASTDAKKLKFMETLTTGVSETKFVKVRVV